MAHAVRGFPLLLVYSGGFSAICPICHFNASVRRFNVWGYPYTAAVLLVLWSLFMALWRGVVPCSVACRLYGVLPACRRSRSPVALSVAGPFSVARAWWLVVWVPPCWPGFRGWRAPLPKSLSESPGKSQKSLAKSLKKSLRSVPKSLVLSQNHSRLQNSVYKGGIFVAHFPEVNGKSCKSRSISAHFTSKSLASMYFCWSCSGVKPSICGWFGVKTISCLSTMP